MNLLYLLSVFPSLTETFILREVRALKNQGLPITIGQLRPLISTPRALGFEDLSTNVITGSWRPLHILRGIFVIFFRHPSSVLRNIATLRYTLTRPRSFAKAIYLLVVSVSIAARVRQTGIKHIHAHYLHTEGLAALFLSRILCVPYSLTCHTVKIYFPESLVQEMAKNAAFVVADTTQVRDFVIQIGVPIERLLLIRNGIEFNAMTLTPESKQVEPPLLLAVGRLDYKKGFHVLLDACALLKARNIKFRCCIVGDGVQRASLEKQIVTKGLFDYVEMKGNLELEQLRAVYTKAWMLVVPSVVAPDGDTDGLPTVCIEAQALGLPVIGSETAAIPEIIQHSVTGLLVRPDDPTELAYAIERLLADGALRKRIVKNAHNRVIEDFDLRRNVAKLARAIENPAVHWSRGLTASRSVDV